MSYIGKTPVVGNFQVCDAISVVNGQAAYTMQVGSANVLPESVNNMLVSLNGVIQKPNTAYTVSGSTITFASNLASGDVIDFIQIFGDVLNIGTPSDGAVTSTKLASNSVTTAKITDANVTGAKTNFVSTSSAAGLQIKGDGTTDGYLQLNCNQNTHGIKLKSPPHSASADYTLTFPNNDGDANQALTTNGSGVLTWATPGGGKILQVLFDSTATQVEITGTAQTATGLSIAITPSATSSKIAIFANISSILKKDGDTNVNLNLTRGGSGISNFGAALADTGSTAYQSVAGQGVAYLDSPNTTSATTYAVTFGKGNANGAARVQQSSGMSTMIVMEIGA